MSDISSSSVETITSENIPEFIAVVIALAIIGVPPTGWMFLRGIRLLPPRAGIIAIGFMRGTQMTEACRRCNCS